MKSAYTLLYGHTFLLLLVTYLGVELLGHRVTLSSAARLFSEAAAPIYIPTGKVREFRFPHLLADTLYC